MLKNVLPFGLIAVLLAGCASQPVDSVATWNIPAAGSSWQVAQKNTGSYGKDATIQVTRGEGMWNGQPVVTLANAGGVALALPDGRWVALVGRDGKPMVTYEPPIGYLYPLSVGQTWKTQHRMLVASGKTFDVEYNCKVEGRETVTVPAGTFNTLKIVCDTASSHDESWTIPELGMHAKQVLERLGSHPQGPGVQRTELVSVSVKSASRVDPGALRDCGGSTLTCSR